MGKQVQDVMTADPVTVSRGDSVVAAAQLMESADVGSVPVVDGGTPIGIVTDRDIAIRVVAQGKDPNRTTVDEIATSQPYYASPEQPLDEALELMAYRKVRRVPVVEDGLLVGMLAQADVVHEVKEKKAAHVIDEISQP
ncbi:MAG TPA: CBS domain-containing protein [Gaiellaceae bacterium]|nr:CBS domain-containing protein [Gaiellaceae bacterium]